MQEEVTQKSIALEIKLAEIAADKPVSKMALKDRLAMMKEKVSLDDRKEWIPGKNAERTEGR